MSAFRVYRADNGNVAIVFDAGFVELMAEEAAHLCDALMPEPVSLPAWHDNNPYAEPQSLCDLLPDDLRQELPEQEPIKPDQSVTSKPPNNRRRWTESDIGEVARMYRDYKTIAEIAEKTGRTPHAIGAILTTRLAHIPRQYPGRAESASRYHARNRGLLPDAESEMPVGEG